MRRRVASPVLGVGGLWDKCDDRELLPLRHRKAFIMGPKRGPESLVGSTIYTAAWRSPPPLTSDAPILACRGIPDTARDPTLGG